MSAFVVDKQDIDLLVLAALGVYPPGRPGFAHALSWWQTDENGDFAGWRELALDAERRESDETRGYYTPSQLGQILVDENVRSVAFRYSSAGRIGYYSADISAKMEDLEETELPGPINRYYLGPYIYEDPRAEITPGQVFALIDRLDYQSCEHDGWRSSEAFAFLTALREAWCRRVVDAERAASDV